MKKRLLSVLLAVSLIFSMTTAFVAETEFVVPEGPNLGIVPFSDSAKVDGIKESIYDNALHLTVDNIVRGADTGATADLWITYDGNYLNIFAEIKDSYIRAEEIASYWNRDNIEIFIDYSGDAYSDALAGAEKDSLSQCVQYRVDALGYPSVYGYDAERDSWAAYGSNSEDGYDDGNGKYASDYFDFAAKIIDGGYTLEYSIPLSNTHTPDGVSTPNAHDNISFNAQLTDMYSEGNSSFSLVSYDWAWDAHDWAELYLGHNIVYVAEQPATIVSSGLKEHYECKVCGAMYKDSLGTVEIVPSDILIPIVVDLEDDTYVKVTEDTVEITEAFVDEAISAAEGEDKVVIDLARINDTDGETIAKDIVVVPAASIEKIAANKQSLEITTYNSIVTLDNEALIAIAEEAAKVDDSTEITVNVSVLDETQIDEELTFIQEITIKDLVKANDKELSVVVSADIICGDEVISGSFGEGSVTIKVPYKNSIDEVVYDVNVIYVADDGSVEEIESVYDDNCVTFTVDHFSEYAIIKTVDPKEEPEEPAPEVPETKPEFNIDAFMQAIILSGIYTKEYNISVNAGEGGMIYSNTGSDTYKYGSTAVYSIVPVNGYEIEAVYVNGVNVGAVPTYTFNYITTSASLSASFRKIVSEEVVSPELEPEVVTVGDLSVKAVSSNAPADAKFAYKVVLSDSTVNGIYGDMIFINGVASVVLGADEEVKAEDLPIGLSYSIEGEAIENCFSTSVGESGEISETEAKAVFINVFYEVEEKIENPITSDAE